MHDCSALSVKNLHVNNSFRGGAMNLGLRACIVVLPWCKFTLKVLGWPFARQGASFFGIL
jgi:hypothetical protein